MQPLFLQLMGFVLNFEQLLVTIDGLGLGDGVGEGAGEGDGDGPGDGFLLCLVCLLCFFDELSLDFTSDSVEGVGDGEGEGPGNGPGDGLGEGLE